MSIKTISKKYGIQILLCCLLLSVVFFLFKDKFYQPENKIIDKRLYAQLSNTCDSNIAIVWNNLDGPTSYVFVLDEKNGEQLFGAGQSGIQDTGNWIHDEVDYEFHLYQDKERTKPIAKLVLVKNGNVITQNTTDLKEVPNDLPTASVPTVVSASAPIQTAAEGPHVQVDKHHKRK